MVKKGRWVRIHNIVLKAEERTARIPGDTKKCDLEMWDKGWLTDDMAEVGEIVTVKTATGRLLQGVLIEEEPHYTHSYGNYVPEIFEIDKSLKNIMEEDW